MARTPLILASILASVAAVSSWPQWSKRINPDPGTRVTPLTGSTWKGRDGDGQPLSCRFAANGVFQFSEALGSAPTAEKVAAYAWFDGGEWRQDGTTITIRMGHTGATYTGKMTGTRISGSVTAPDGKDRSWWITRDR